MRIYKNTQGYSEPKEIDANPYKVFVAKNIHFVEVDPTPIEEGMPERQSYWEYDLYEYDSQEYVYILQQENSDLKTELLDTQMALCDIYEAML